MGSLALSSYKADKKGMGHYSYTSSFRGKHRGRKQASVYGPASRLPREERHMMRFCILIFSYVCIM